MPRVIAQGQPARALTLLTYSSGILVAPYSVSFQILDIATDQKLAAPTEITTGTLDLTADRLSVGRFGCPYQPSQSGRQRIIWTYQLTSGGPSLTAQEDFLVTDEAYQPAGYATVPEMRDEGVGLTDAADARLLDLIRSASQLVERVTGRYFEPRYQSFHVEAEGGETLKLPAPVIAIEDVLVEGDSWASKLIVYNRVVAENLVDPDDRNYPRLRLCGRTWPKRHRRVTVVGVFGFTDWDGSPAGVTPAAIGWVTRRLVRRGLPQIMDAEGLDDEQNRGRLFLEQTRDQQWEFDNKVRAAGAIITGDFEIDAILNRYRRPGAIRAV